MKQMQRTDVGRRDWTYFADVDRRLDVGSYVLVPSPVVRRQPKQHEKSFLPANRQCDDPTYVLTDSQYLSPIILHTIEYNILLLLLLIIMNNQPTKLLQNTHSYPLLVIILLIFFGL